MLKYNPKTIFEIGVGSPYLCRTANMMGGDVNLKLFEPHPDTFNQLKQNYGHFKNLELYNLAIFDFDGFLKFSKDGDSSFVSQVLSPTKYTSNLTNKVCEEIYVECKSIKNFDNGNIDIALIDTEGSEWFILKEMISRPKLIVIETHNDDCGYENENIDLIFDWMSDNNYKLINRDSSDSYFEQK